WRAGWRKNEHFNIRQIGEGLLDSREDIAPIQTAISTAERRQSDGPNPKAFDSCAEIDKTSLNILQPAPRFPVTLRWKVDDPPRTASQSAKIEHLHLSQVNIFRLTSLLVSAIHLRIRLPELKCHTFAHHADGIDRIHQRFSGCFQEISFGGFDHG